MAKKMTVHMVPSTHWDREWYLPFRRYQIRLVRVMDKIIHLLETGKDPYFVLDGQTIMIEDYLEVKPWMKERLHKLIKAGKLIVGPWYVVPDMFIPCGESLWSNLQIGADIKAEYEGVGKVGYSPDSFGSTGQAPQMYAHFGNEYSMYTHGLRVPEDESISEHNFAGPVRFTAPDGTEVLAESSSYNIGAVYVVPTVWGNFTEKEVSPQQAVESMKQILASPKEMKNPYRTRLVVCGIDHIEPRENFLELIAALNEAFEDVEFKASTLDMYFEDLNAEIESGDAAEPPVAFGEQRGSYKEHFCRSNTASARVDIKMKNRRAENTLYSYVSGLNLYEKPCKPFDFLDRDAILHMAEKELVKAHPHDSICSCSVDEVNQDVKNRLTEVTQITDEILKDDLLKIGASLEGQGGMIMVYNCLPFARSMMVEGKLAVPYKVNGNCICENGRVLEDSVAEVLFHKRQDIETMKYVYFEELEQDGTRFAEVDGKLEDSDYYTGVRYRFTAEDVPAMGFKCYTLGWRDQDCACDADAAAPADKAAAEQNAKAAPAVSENAIANDKLRLTVNADGSVDVFDLQKQVLLSGAHVLECSVDEGDEYTYSNRQKLFCCAKNAAVVKKNVDGAVSSIRVAYEIAKPAAAADSGVDRNGIILVESEFRLEKGSDIVKVKTEITNSEADFRLRVLFRTPGNPANVYADTAFDLTSRQVYQREQLGLGGIVTMSCRNLVNVPADGYELALYTKSSQEFETVKEDGYAVTALTLMRSVRRVYVTNTLTRDETALGVGTRWFTKDGTMQGTTELEYAFRIMEEGKDAVSRCNEALCYQLPLFCHGIAPEGSSSLKDFGMTLTGAVLSRIEKRNDRVIARIFNPAQEDSIAVFGFASGKVLEVKMGKKKIENVDITGYLS